MPGRRRPRRMWLVDDAPILICFDGSAGAMRALAAARELLGPRRAVVIDIAPPITASESLASLAPSIPANAFVELNTADAARTASRGAELARASGFDADAREALAAPTWEGIVDAADELDAAVIVIGSRGLTGLRELLDGSLSHDVAEHAGRPVLIMPPPHDER
jgi:nucleotide-binding universal stress UspA family protein